MNRVDPSGQFTLLELLVTVAIILILSPDIANAPGPEDTVYNSYAEFDIIFMVVAGTAIAAGVQCVFRVVGRTLFQLIKRPVTISLNDGDVVVGVFRDGRIMAAAKYGDDPMLAPSHGHVARSTGLLAENGSLLPRTEAFTVVKQGEDILIRGSMNYNPTVSVGTEATLRKTFK